MAHSYDSTLLQRMGFKDPDRKTPEHDRACIELACHPEKLLRVLGIDGLKPKSLLESPLQKGDGKYATTVGFIDAIIEWTSMRTTIDCNGLHHERTWKRCEKCRDREVEDPNAMLVEVKTKIESIGDLLRQMNLYREYKRSHTTGYHRSTTVDPFVVWSLSLVDDEYSGLLASQGYTLLVGPSLDRIDGAPSR